MGLSHPRDLDAWRTWQQSMQPTSARLRGAASRALRTVRSIPSHHATLTTGGPTPRVLVCLESRSPTSVSALLRPLHHLPTTEIAVLAPTPVSDLLPHGQWTELTDDAADLAYGLAEGHPVVLSTGHYLPLGGLLEDVTSDRDRFVTVQHGLLTPQAPPLAEGTTLLTFSDADADFWRSGRDDVTTHTVGSQLLWDASLDDSIAVDAAAPPVFLGQLHGAELPRATMERSAETFCLANHAAYRPHPSETDRQSRRTHARFERLGIEIDRSGVPLTELRRPVVSAFSTGVLEAAAHGIPAWVHFSGAPAWLSEFWDRYGLAPWGGAPTAPPHQPHVEPARAVADHVLALLGESS